MNLDYYVVDAFADEVFKGNPAAVYVLEEWLPEGTMQKIAIENNFPKLTINEDPVCGSAHSNLIPYWAKE